MAIIKLQGEEERRAHIYYEFDSAEGLLGVGGMGDVYRGVCVNELTLGRTPVAIKYIRPCINYQLVVEHARREASIRIKHENLMEMKGFIEVSQRNVLQEVKKSYYVVSELLDGVSLDAVLKGQLCGMDGREIPYARKLYTDYTTDSRHFGLLTVRSILAGVMALHDAGYIHRDIDPTNIMVTRDGKIKLFDFGIARKIDDLDTSESGLMVSKVAYASPELIKGEVQKHSKPTDFYMIGILLYQLIVGHLPFDGELTDIIEQHRSKPVPLAAFKRNDDVRDIIKKATEKEPEKRYLSAAEFIVAIEHALVSTSPPPFPWMKIAVSVLILVVGLWVYRECSKPKPPPQEVRTYDDCLELLLQGDNEGIELLDSLYDVEDYRATYLKSRLLYKSTIVDEFLDPDVQKIKEKFSRNKFEGDNEDAHRVLKKSVELNDSYYKSLYEIGRDYFISKKRSGIDLHGNTLETRKIAHKEAARYFKKALGLARESNDTLYVNEIMEELNKPELYGK